MPISSSAQFALLLFAYIMSHASADCRGAKCELAAPLPTRKVPLMQRTKYKLGLWDCGAHTPKGNAPLRGVSAYVYLPLSSNYKDHLSTVCYFHTVQKEVG